MTTIHSYTGDQRIPDNSHRDRAVPVQQPQHGSHHHWCGRRRCAAYPEVKGKLTGFAMRVPTPMSPPLTSPSTPRATSADEVKVVIKAASEAA